MKDSTYKNRLCHWTVYGKISQILLEYLAFSLVKYKSSLLAYIYAMRYNSRLYRPANGAYRVAGIVRRDNFILSLSEKRELFITPGRGESVTQA